MTDEQIYQKLEKTYESEGGKKFISHLLRSFFPVHKSEFIWEKKAKPIRCCITGDQLISKDEAFQAMVDTTSEEFMEYLKASFDPEKAPVEHPVKKKLGKKILGIECKDSDKYLCKQAFDQLYNFYASKLLSGDGHMSWLAKNMMAEAGIKSLKKEIGMTEKEEKVVKKTVNQPKKMTLGDLGVLQELKDKLQKQEKEKGNK